MTLRVNCGRGYYKMLSVSFLLLLAFLGSATLASAAQKEIYFYLKSVAHSNYYLTAGEKADNNVYYQNNKKNAETAMWTFTKVSGGGGVYYTITDKKHRRGLAAGERADNHVYHQSDLSRAVARWEITTVPGSDGTYTFRIQDSANKGYLACGEANDSHIYSKVGPYEHMASYWIIEPVEPITKLDDVPDFLLSLMEVKVSDVKFGTPTTLPDTPPTVVHKAHSKNDSASPQQHAIEYTSATQLNETLTVSESLSQKEMHTIGTTLSIRVGADQHLVSGGASVTYSYTNGKVTTTASAKSVSTTTEKIIKIIDNITVSPHSDASYEGLIKITKQSIPYTAKVQRTLRATNFTDVKEIKGVWTGVSHILLDKSIKENKL